MKIGHMLFGLGLALSTNRVIADMFAGYDSFCGLPVVVGPDAQVATARKDQAGNNFIHIDPGAISNWTTSRMFTLAHECAHHLLGHSNPLGEFERYSGGTAKQELEADCWAAQKLRGIGVDSEITRTILDHAKAGHFSAGGYPSGSQRAQNILACATQGDGVRMPVCQNVQVSEVYMDFQVVMQPVQTACQHCGCNGWGQCGCAHQFDITTQPVQVPIQRTRLVTRQVCQ